MTSLPGFVGQLVTPSYLARTVADGQTVAGMDDIRIDALRTTTATALATARHVLGPASGVRQIFEVGVAPLLGALGFALPERVRVTDRYLSAVLCRAQEAAVTVLVTPWAEPLDGSWRYGVVEAQRAGAAWCILANGPEIRVVDATRLYARRFVGCSLVLALDQAESFAGLLRIAGSRALLGRADQADSLHALVAASDRDAAGVCRSLRDGVLAASTDVLQALAARQRQLAAATLDSTFEQSLTIVYRLVFLLFAEARLLVPMWHPVYRHSYSVEALREAADAARATGLWDALRAITRLAHAGCRAGDLRVTPFNGRLFAPSRTPLAERRDLDDDAARRAVLALSTRPAPDRAGRERIVYRELGVEQLGAVYETLLDYRPHVQPSNPRRGSQRPIVSLETGSGLRKATGTFYTPQRLAEYLVRRTLAPLVANAEPDAILRLRVVDPAMGSGAFLVAACRFLAAAYERALIDGGACHASDIADSDRSRFRRLVAERCLYGIDLNPMAVQLARLSLWLATLAAERPLSFLDHRLVVGDSLLGAWLHQLRCAPAAKRRHSQPPSLPLFDAAALAGTIVTALPIRFSLESIPDDTIDQVRTKERALAALSDRSSSLSRWKRVADLWCSTWFDRRGEGIPARAYSVLADSIVTGSSSLPPRLSSDYLARADAIGAEKRFVHWELEFPEVFFDAAGQRRIDGGFDAVLGNPPWDMLRADAGDDQARAGSRADVSASLRFTRDAGAYAAQSTGHANRYQLFVERAIALTRPDGRIGLILPSGLVTDHGNASLRRRLFTECSVDALVGIDNTRAVFPIHRSVRFLLLTATAGRPTRSTACRFGVESASELDAIEEGDAATGAVIVTSEILDRISGSELAIPYVRQAIDLRICEKAATLFPTLGSSASWSATFGRELNATDDRDRFRPHGDGWPVVEGKHVEPFCVATAKAERSIAPADARLLLGDRVERPRLAYRDVASATNRLTLIAALLPARTVSTHTVFCLRTPLSQRDQHALCALFNSFVVNYLVRLRVTTHVTTGIVERLPVPPFGDAPMAFRQLAALGRLLTRRRGAEALAQLNAIVARLYQLTGEEFEHVLDSFPLIAEAERSRAFELFVANE